jgi:hypothetical protein
VALSRKSPYVDTPNKVRLSDYYLLGGHMYAAGIHSNPSMIPIRGRVLRRCQV